MMNGFEEKCYGTSVENIREDYMNSLTARFSGLEMVVMSLLSDCQEMLDMDERIERAAIVDARIEVVRKQLNIAKFILGEQLKTRMEA
jgi:hypothetical protein